MIRLCGFRFLAAVFFTLLAVVLNLCWNYFLAGLPDRIPDLFSATPSFARTAGVQRLFSVLASAVVIVFLLAACEYLSAYLGAFVCESFAHEMRMGYTGYYLQRDIRALSSLNPGEEQAAMTNELKEVSDYLSGNLFPLLKQFTAFAATAIFLFCRSSRLAVLSILPVIPLIYYCSFSSRIIKDYTQQCLESRKKLSGLTDMILELFPVIQVYNAHAPVRDVARKTLREWEAVSIKSERVCARLMSLSGVLSFLPLLIMLCLGGLMVADGQVSVGTFYIFINLSGNISGFLQNMPGIYAGLRRFCASACRLEEKLIWKEEPTDGRIRNLFRQYFLFIRR